MEKKKDLWVIPTDKPSRLTLLNNERLLFSKEDCELSKTKRCVNQHIYITSDEEIKEGDWCLDETFKPVNLWFYPEKLKGKIILTTDQDLINDGVQAIEDSFLKWFVKNPSCEKADIKKIYLSNKGEWKDVLLPSEWEVDTKINYKIIIPKEEQCTCKEQDPYCCQVHGMCPTCVKKEEPKQETLEEAAERYQKSTVNKMAIEKIAFEKGYTECKEKMYSEEDLRNAWEDGRNNVKIVGTYPFVISKFQYNSFSKWFEQFKKKTK